MIACYTFRLFEEMKIFFNFDMEIPASDSMLIQELGKWLRMAGSLTKVVVVLDALNQLDDGSGDADGIYQFNFYNGNIQFESSLAKVTQTCYCILVSEIDFKMYCFIID